MFCLCALIILDEIRLNTYYDLNKLKNCIMNSAKSYTTILYRFWAKSRTVFTVLSSWKAVAKYGILMKRIKYVSCKFYKSIICLEFSLPSLISLPSTTQKWWLPWNGWWFKNKPCANQWELIFARYDKCVRSFRAGIKEVPKLKSLV